jgi:hypothetical protein
MCLNPERGVRRKNGADFPSVLVRADYVDLLVTLAILVWVAGQYYKPL